MTTLASANPKAPRSGNAHLWQSFLLALGIAAVIFLPFVIFDRGFFIYYGDFNVQQIPFYQLAHEAVRGGDMGWSWHTDLGANFVGSYSFYLLFSPFFWLTLPFPTEVVPHLMAPLLVLKTACSALTACLYLERFVKNRSYAVIGSLLYAFSGWMFFNIFFNHFHDVAVFFPLLLLAVEKLVCDGDKGVLAAVVALNVMVNYWFFVGEAVFVILYVFVRMTDKSWPMSLRKFARLCFEAVLGVGMSALFMIPSVLAILGNPRTGSGELINGWQAWLYWHEQRQPAIIQSLFFPPELPARPNFLPDHGAKWSSLSGWLPLFGMTGVLAYFFREKNDWLKKMLALCLVCALVPWLNSLFVLLNDSYYARWFYMPILLMAVATARALEDSRRDTAYFGRAVKWSLVVWGVFVVMSGLTPNYDDEHVLRFGLADSPYMLWMYALITAVCLLLVALTCLGCRAEMPILWPSLALAALAYCLLYRYGRFSAWQNLLVCFAVVLLTFLLRYLYRRVLPLLKIHFAAVACSCVALVSVVFGIFFMANGKNDYERSQFVINTGIKGREVIELPEEPFARIDIYDGMDNQGMFWRQPTIQAFHSIVPPSIMEFYPEVGVKRDVGSRPEAEFYALRPLLSVRWLFIDEEDADQSPMPGFTPAGNQLGFNVYENDNYLPMGFGYTQFLTRSQLDSIPQRYRSNIMLRAVVLEDEEAGLYSGFLTQLPVEEEHSYTSRDMEQDVQDRRSQAAYAFARDQQGFTAHSNLEKETLLFFSVPLEAGWSAAVNGEPADIIQANIGFMGVYAPAGETEIRFDYQTPGLGMGGKITAASAAVWLAYAVAARRRRRPSGEPDSLSGNDPLREVHLTWEEFQRQYGDKEARARRLRETLDAAAPPPDLPQEERTMPFKPPEDGNTGIGAPDLEG